ncbi:hypothetical protein SpCBS45565_g00945 [Spizellomyces sp. 'palustris']|nr:hypothetical protein SpCBS45565_g00945 [Spizellomyces sp. 'palustris']
MATRTEQVLSRKASIDAEKVGKTCAHLEKDHTQAPELAFQHAREKAAHAAAMSAHAAENLHRKEVQDAAKVNATLENLRSRSEHALEVAEHHKAEVSQHAAETAMYPASLEGVVRREEENELRRMELQEELERKAEQSERLRRDKLEEVKGKARAFERPFEH